LIIGRRLPGLKPASEVSVRARGDQADAPGT
jgi:hypothetical protein